MTIDERAAACAEDVVAAINRLWDWENPNEPPDVDVDSIIARHLREAVAERDALLSDVYKHVGNGSPKRHALPPYLRDAIREVLFPGSQARIDAMRSEQA